MANLNGSCICGDVEFTAQGNVNKVTACHCAMCRKQNGGGAFYTAVVDGQLNFKSETGLSWYKSSDWAERGFCNHCGSTLFWRLKGKDHFDISLGTLENPPSELDAHIFTDEAGSYETLTTDAPHKTGTEVIAEFMENQ